MLWSTELDSKTPVTVEVPAPLVITTMVLGNNAKPNQRHLVRITYEDPLEDENATTTIGALSLGHNENVALSLNFDTGERFTVVTSGGTGTVHLTGNFIVDDDESLDDEEEEAQRQLFLQKYLAATAGDDEEDSEDEDYDGPRVEELSDSDDEGDSALTTTDDSVDSDDMDDDPSAEIMKQVAERAAAAKKAREQASKAEPSKPAEEPKKLSKAEKRAAKKAKKLAKKEEKKDEKKDKQTGKRKAEPHKDEPPQKKAKANPVRKYKNGLQLQDVVVGSGSEAVKGKNVKVQYVGKLRDGKQFDQGTFQFRLGTREVITGWDLGLVGMKVGGTRRLVIPPSLGYGSRKEGPIPANSILHFEVKLLSA